MGAQFQPSVSLCPRAQMPITSLLRGCDSSSSLQCLQHIWDPRSEPQMFSTFLLLLSKVTNQKFITLLVGKPSPDTLHSVLMHVVIGLQLHPASIQVRGEKVPTELNSRRKCLRGEDFKAMREPQKYSNTNHLTQRQEALPHSESSAVSW